MRLHVIPSPYYAANALVLVPAQGSAALVVDPSAGVQHLLREVLDLEGVGVGGVLATHGHPDHVWDCAAVAGWTDGPPLPVYLPGPDVYRMDDPAAHVPLPVPGFAGEWVKPERVEPMPADAFEIVEGVRLRMLPAPGHSEGSALFLGECDLDIRVDNTSFYHSDGPVPWALSGDVIFRGSVGRTDLPGGDETQMRHSLRTVSNAIDPATVLIPGHGPATTMAEEIAANEYLIRARRIG